MTLGMDLAHTPRGASGPVGGPAHLCHIPVALPSHSGHPSWVPRSAQSTCWGQVRPVGRAELGLGAL